MLESCPDVGQLAKADQYFAEIMSIPRLRERIECMVYRRRLELEIEELRPELNIVHKASHEMRGSVRLKRVLQVRIFSIHRKLFFIVLRLR